MSDNAGKHDYNRVRETSDRNVAGNLDGGDKSGTGPAMDDATGWNYMPTPDASIDVEIDKSMLEYVGEVDRIILAMAVRGVDITEVYSPERVAKACAKFGLTPGTSMDFTNGWDFDTEADRTRAEHLVDTEKPMLLIGSPPCTYMSMLQELNKWINKENQEWLDKFELNRQGAIRHMEFRIKLYRKHMKAGRYFLHEHTWTARSWDLDSMKALTEDNRVMYVQTHMCQFGMESHIDKVGGDMGPVKKPIGLASNSWAIMRELDM